ncbi:hypothetical protein IAR55_000893 [Kwoniella newhampshirensis]|uniref:Uncharacterized protein n=1 Tax=Kwoniella newhampshirensis TaxID=1651941 RepID=A0AAW0Z4Y4_9TREE
MQGPTPIWTGYNLLRLVAVVFLTWTLIAQFIAIADDMKAYTLASSAARNATITSTEQTSSTRTPTDTSTSSVSPNVTRSVSKDAGIAKWGSATTISTGEASATSLITSSPSNRVSSGPFDGSGSDMNGSDEVGGQVLPLPNVKRAIGVTADETGSGANWGLSSVPRQAGGTAFAVMSRLVIATTLGFLVLGQAGLPEMFLYRWVPWLGPHSTPLWLGLGQFVVAVEILRVYAKSMMLIPAWGVLAVGLINLTLGSVLLCLARRLPKYPPPPLYFNLSTRFLFFRPAPQCYQQLFDDPWTNVGEERITNLPSANAKETGLDGDEEKTLAMNGRRTQDEREPSISACMNHKSHHDVRQGGYPTFSGGRMTDPGRQVPTGFLERGKGGRGMEFVINDGKRSDKGDLKGVMPKGSDGQVESGGGLSDLPPLPAKNHKSRSAQRVDDLPFRGQSKKPAPVPPKMPSIQQVASPRRAEILAGQNIPRKAAIVNEGGPIMSNAMRAGSSMDRARASTMNGKRGKMPMEPASTRRQSISLTAPPPVPMKAVNQANRQSSLSSVSAANDLAPRFPFPPSRQPSGDSPPDKSLTSQNERQRCSGIETKPAVPHSKIDGQKTPKSAQSRQKDKREPEIQDQTKRTRRADRSLHQPKYLSPPSSAITIRQADPDPLGRAHTFDSHSPRHTHRQAAPDVPPLQSSMIKCADRLTRSNSARSTRTARGVRFDLNKVEAQSPPQYRYSSADEDSLKSPPRTGIRIPGTNVHVPIPGMATPRSTIDHSRPESYSSSVSGTGTEFESESDRKGHKLMASTEIKSPSVQAFPAKTDRPRTMTILGGGYLTGGMEVYRQRRPSSATVDSRDSREL